MWQFGGIIMNKKQAVLNHLKSGKSITKFQAFNKFAITNLGDVVFKLRNAGHSIITDMRKNKNTKSIYAVYKQAQ